MKKRIMLQSFLVIAVAVMTGLLLAGCGEKPAVESNGQETAKPSEEDFTVYDGAYRFNCNGWVYLHIEGEPYQRGFQHGYLLAPEIGEALATIKQRLSR